MALIEALERRAHPSNPDRWWINHVNGQPSAAGVTVNEDTALSATAVWSGVRLISETIAMLPLKVKERVDERTKKDARQLGLYYVLHDQPNEEQTSFEFREMQQGFLLLWGNCYAQKRYNGRGEVSELWPLVPWRVTPERSPGNVLTYRITLPGNAGGTVLLPADDVLHIRGFSSSGLLGDNVVEKFRNAIGLSLAAEAFGGRFFGNGLTTSGGLKHPGKLGPNGRKNLRDSVNEQHQGVDRSHNLLILEEGLEYFRTDVDPVKAQALESRQFQVTEVARILRLPPHLLYDLERSTNNNIEHQGQEFVTYTMQPWLTRWEQRLNRSLLLPSQRSRYFTQFEVKGLLRGDSVARSAFYTSMFNVGAYSPNDILENEDEEPVEGGDQRFVQGAMVPIDKVAALVEAQMKAKTQPAPAAQKEPDDREPEPRSVRRPDPYTALEPVVRAEADRIVRRQVRAIGGAMKKPPQEFRVWVDGFFEKEAALVEESLAPVLISMAALAGDTINARAFAMLDTERALAEVRKTLTSPDEFDARITALLARWESDRAQALTGELVQRGPNRQAS